MFVKKNKNDISIQQEPIFRRRIQLKITTNLCTMVFSLAFQLLPIFVMLLIQFIIEYNFDILEYISNLISYVVVSSAISLSGLFRKDLKKNRKEKMFNILVFIGLLCFSSILYGIVMLCDIEKIGMKKYNLLLITSILVFLILTSSFVPIVLTPRRSENA